MSWVSNLKERVVGSHADVEEQKAKEHAKAAYREGMEAGKNAYEATKDRASQFYEGAKGNVGNMYEGAKENIGQAYEKGKENVNSLYEGAKENVRDNVNTAYDYVTGPAAKEAKETANAAYEYVKGSTKETAEQAKERANEAQKSAKGTYEGTKHKAGALYEEAKEKVGEAYESAKDTVSSLWSGAKTDTEGWNKIFASREWNDYFRETGMDPSWWRGFLTASHVPPGKWHDYIDAWRSGPTQMRQFWYDLDYGPTEQKMRDIWGRPSTQGGGILGAARRALIGGGTKVTEFAPASTIWGALLLTYFVVLMNRVVRKRRETNVWVGDGSIEISRQIVKGQEDPGITKRYLSLMQLIQAVQTYVSYAAFGLLTFLCLELSNHVGTAVLHLLYLMLFAGQVLELDYGLLASLDGKAAGRYTGMGLTWMSLALGSVMGLWTGSRMVMGL